MHAALSSCKELEWRCVKCKKGASKAASLDAVIADRLGEVLVAIGGVLDCLAGFEDRLRDKTDLGRTIALESGVKALEEKMLAVERLTEGMSNFEKLESRIIELERMLGPGCKQRDEKGGGEERSGMSVKREAGHDGVDRWEMEERLKRRTCVIVHGLEESDSVDAAVRREADQARVTDMFRELRCGDAGVDIVIRLGKKEVPVNGIGPKPRPLKLVLESEEMKTRLLVRAKNLRNMKEGGWSRVFVHRDLTPMERRERRAAWQEMRNRGVGRERDMVLTEGGEEAERGSERE